MIHRLKRPSASVAALVFVLLSLASHPCAAAANDKVAPQKKVSRDIKKAPRSDADEIARLMKKAKEGDLEAQGELAYRYTFGTGGVTKNIVEAARLYGCPEIDEEAMNACAQITLQDLPVEALPLLRKYACDVIPTSTYNYGNAVALKTDKTGEKDYQFCCRDVPFGPCAAKIISKIDDEWKDIIGENNVVAGYAGACNAMILLKSQHNGYRDLCLPGECKRDKEKKTCAPKILEFRDGEYRVLKPSSQTAP